MSMNPPSPSELEIISGLRSCHDLQSRLSRILTENEINMRLIPLGTAFAIRDCLLVREAQNRDSDNSKALHPYPQALDLRV